VPKEVVVSALTCLVLMAEKEKWTRAWDEALVLPELCQILAKKTGT